MHVTVADIIRILDEMMPPSPAQQWDNVGLQVGDPGRHVHNIWVALDPSPEVVAAACRGKVDLLITHHPLIFKPLSCVDFQQPVGAIIDLAARHRLAIFAAHTNLDSVAGGVNDILAGRIGLRNLQPLEAAVHGSQSDAVQGIGRVGDLQGAIALEPLALRIKESLGLAQIRFAGDCGLAVERAAVCSGSGGGLLPAFFSSGAQVYVSGDLRYHDAREIQAAHLGLVDIGHFASEHLVIEVLAKRLEKIVAQKDFNVTVRACDLESDPFEYR